MSEPATETKAQRVERLKRELNPWAAYAEIERFARDGVSSIPGAVLGGLLIGTSEVMVVGYLSSTYRDAIAFAILILVLIIRPQGLLGRVQKEKV